MSDRGRARIETRGLTKRYGQRLALDHLDLAVMPGELVALVGENGAGKTTTLSMLSGQLVPDEGQALVGGHEVFGEPLAARRALGFVAQDLLLPPYLTVLEMVEFACGVKHHEVDQARLERLLGRAGLAGDADRLIGELSHGMQRKAAWVVALVAEPRALILDEGLAGLDASSSAALVDEIALLLGDGLAVLWAEHDLDRFAAHLTRVEVLRQGRRVEAVPGEAVREALAKGELPALMRSWTGDAEPRATPSTDRPITDLGPRASHEQRDNPES